MNSLKEIERPFRRDLLRLRIGETVRNGVLAIFRAWLGSVPGQASCAPRDNPAHTNWP